MKKTKLSLLFISIFSSLVFLVGSAYASDRQEVLLDTQQQNSLVYSSGQIVPYGTGSWNYNTFSSALTLSNGTITVYSNPGVNDEISSGNFVSIEVYKDEGDGVPGLYSSKNVSAFKSESATFKNLTGKFYVKVLNVNYPWLTGTFTVLW